MTPEQSRELIYQRAEGVLRFLKELDVETRQTVLEVALNVVEYEKNTWSREQREAIIGMGQDAIRGVVAPFIPKDLMSMVSRKSAEQEEEQNERKRKQIEEMLRDEEP